VYRVSLALGDLTTVDERPTAIGSFIRYDGGDDDSSQELEPTSPRFKPRV
jgi:hypothetical protein